MCKIAEEVKSQNNYLSQLLVHRNLCLNVLMYSPGQVVRALSQNIKVAGVIPGQGNQLMHEWIEQQIHFSLSL